jgi:hypothetical protein
VTLCETQATKLITNPIEIAPHGLSASNVAEGCDLRSLLHDRVTALRTANIYERHSYRHIVGLPVIGEAGDDGLAVETPFLVARIMRDGRTDLFATGVLCAQSSRIALTRGASRCCRRHFHI